MTSVHGADPLRTQAAEQQWLEPACPTNNDKFLEQRIEELEQQVAAYDALLNELPDLFERKFQERLAPILERHQLLSEQQTKNASAADTPLLQSTKSPDNVVRFPGIKLMSFLGPRRRSA